MKSNYIIKSFLNEYVVEDYLTRLQKIDQENIEVKSLVEISRLIDIPKSSLINLRKKDDQIDALCKKIITKHFNSSIAKTCESCQNPFNTRRLNQRFCSIECARKQMGKIVTKPKAQIKTQISEQSSNSISQNATREPFCIYYDDCLNQVALKNGTLNCEECPDQTINNPFAV